MPTGNQDILEIISNIQIDIFLNRNDAADKLGVMQTEHKKLLMMDIPNGKEQPLLEEEPLKRHLATTGTFPFHQ
jgi:hypothetical protein